MRTNSFKRGLEKCQKGTHCSSQALDHGKNIPTNTIRIISNSNFEKMFPKGFDFFRLDKALNLSKIDV